MRAVFELAIVGHLPGAMGLTAGVSASTPTAQIAIAAALPGVGLRLRIAPQAELAVSARLPGAQLAAQLVASVPLHIAGQLPGPAMAATASYASNTQRPTVGYALGVWQVAAAQTGAATLANQGGVREPTDWGAPWQRATSAPAPIAHPLPEVLRPALRQVQLRHQDATGRHDASHFAHQHATRAPHQHTGLFDNAWPVRRASGFAHQDGDRTRRTDRAPRHQNARHLQRPQSVRHQVARWAVWSWAGRHQDAGAPPPGISRPPVPPPPPPFLGNAHLLFCWAQDYSAHLIFGHRCGQDGSGNGNTTIVISPQRVYIVQNNITLTRVDTGAPLDALSFSASLDMASWTWQWSAALHESAADHLGRNPDGTPPEVVASINGQLLRLCIERVQLNEQFLPQRRYSVSGRGRSAVLASPWAPVLQHGGQDNERTAQQLANEALTINGVGIGWGVDWQIDDWVVPAGVWTQQGSYIDALADIATSVGAYLQPHATDKIVRVLPKYSAAPWQWASLVPDVQLPKDAVQQLGTEYIDKPAYNGIYVGGVQAGVFGPVTRAGTIGDLQAPQVTHALITDATAHRMRGIAELADTGRQRRVQLSMQVLPAVGLILPGKLVQVGSGAGAMRGIVRAAAVEWGAPRLRQNLELEVHD